MTCPAGVAQRWIYAKLRLFRSVPRTYRRAAQNPSKLHVSQSPCAKGPIHGSITPPYYAKSLQNATECLCASKMGYATIEQFLAIFLFTYIYIYIYYNSAFQTKLTSAVALRAYLRTIVM